MDSARLEEIRQSELGLEYFPLARLEKDELLGHIDSLAAQVAALREALTEVRIEEVAPFVSRIRGAKRVAELLADTEAAATAWLEAHDREQRLEGARGFENWLSEREPSLANNHAWFHDYATMEREAGQ